MSNDTTQRTPADVRGRILRASILPFEDEETLIAGLRAGAEAVGRGELDVEDFVGVWSQYLRQLLRASSVPAPADVWEHVVWLLSQWVDELEMHWEDPEDDVEPAGVGQIADEILALLRTPRGDMERVATTKGGEMSERTLQALRDRINARLQTSAISRDRASAAGREVVAQCRQSDVETLEWVLSEIDAVLAALRSDAQEKEDALVCASCGEPIGDEPTVIWQDAYTHYRYTPEDAIRDDTPVIRPIDAARRGEGGGE